MNNLNVVAIRIRKWLHEEYGSEITAFRRTLILAQRSGRFCLRFEQFLSTVIIELISRVVLSSVGNHGGLRKPNLEDLTVLTSHYGAVHR